MFEIVLVYSIVILLGLFSAIFPLSRIVAARNPKGRKRDMFSLLGSIIILAIAISAIYLCLYEILPRLAVVLMSGIALALNYFVLGKYSKPNGNGAG
jgi:hypothetical protein